jgi:anti-sigma B factor antagonist
MKIEKRQVKDVTVFDLKGKILIGDSIDVLREAIKESLDRAEKNIILNFDSVPYLDSTGLGEVVRSYTSVKKEDGVIKIANLTDKVQDLLSVTKLITVFEVFDTVDEAVDSF